MTSIVLYGGTFDPPHEGHVAAVRSLIAGVHPDEVVIAVAEAPAYRERPERSAHDRRLLARAAFIPVAHEARSQGVRIHISDVERRLTERYRGRPVRTIDVVREITRERPGHRIGVAIGADQLASFQTWEAWRELLRESDLLVVPRPDVVDDQTLEASISELRAEVPVCTIRVVPMPRMPVSSTDVREGIRRKGVASVADRVPQRVLSMLDQAH